VQGAPLLDADFRAIFASHRIQAGDLALHAVIGGRGPPLLLIPGWPQTWFAWRLMMPTLARDFTVIAVDPRGAGLSDKPPAGYDSAAQAVDMLNLMSALGHERFALIGHDMGMWTGYALAADAPARVARAALGEAIIPGIAPSPLLIDPNTKANDRLWHFAFNRVRGINEDLVRGREEIYFGYQFRSKAATPIALEQPAIDLYVEMIRRDPAALSAAFEGYRGIDLLIEQTLRRKQTKLTVPVLAFAGELACGRHVEQEMNAVANDVVSVVISGCGHFVPEEAPDALLAALGPFLEPYRLGH
jgi:pimeloyl-ACP methyl ester carboxylesterase